MVMNSDESPRRRTAKIVSTSASHNGTARVAAGALVTGELVTARFGCRRVGGCGLRNGLGDRRDGLLRWHGAGRRRHDLSDAVTERLDLGFPIVEQVDPLPGGQFVGERRGGDDVFHAGRNDRHFVLAGERQLFLDLGRVVGVVGEDQDHHLGRADGGDDRLLEILSRADVTAGDPAGQAAVFEGGAKRPRDRLVLGRVADEDRAHVLAPCTRR